MNKISILLIIMTTFFMDGCVSNNEDAIKYFDQVYLPIQEVIELDNVFQESIHEMLIATDELDHLADTLIDEQQYDLNIDKITANHKKLSDYIDTEIAKMKDIQVFNNEVELQRGGIATLESYKKATQTDFLKMIEILRKIDHNENDAEVFNAILSESNKLLNFELEKFYNIAFDYGDQYGIDLESDEE